MVKVDQQAGKIHPRRLHSKRRRHRTARLRIHHLHNARPRMREHPQRREVVPTIPWQFKTLPVQ
ncbi:MAG: hypothetical protein JJU05_06945 [Verrucomicrobia bacterium]|nr:hypothetical protein [Verrucomicrobiota bacterium]MCH8527016.1 hypothetical protein [Kiritimatiellia bacterium]